MKMNTIRTMAIIVAALTSISLQAEIISKKSNTIMELPTYYVYPTKAETIEKNASPIVTEWEFQKSLDFQSEPVVITVMGPGEEEHDVSTPKIQTSLIREEAENS